MLPPVRAPSSVSPDYQTQAPQIAARPRLDLSNAHLHAAANDMPLSGDRLDILSLSGQLQIARGSSIFAETIGALLDMPRGENEPLTDYAKRLTDAVKAMSPGERAVLERMLNQLVKGVSVRLLAEILNNPAGLEAAKLAMSIEGARFAGTDQATSAVVSSYRQNGGDSPSAAIAAAPLKNPIGPADGQPAAPNQAQTAPAQAVQVQTTGGPTTAPDSAAQTIFPSTAQQAQAAADTADDTAGLAMPEVMEAGTDIFSERGEQGSEAGNRSMAPGSRPPPAAPTPINAGGLRPAGPATGDHGNGQAGGPLPAAMATGGNGLAAAVPTGISGRLAQTVSAQMPDMPAGAAKMHGEQVTGAQKPEHPIEMLRSEKHADGERHAGPDMIRANRPVSEHMPAALAEWLAEVFAADLNDASTLPALLARAPATSLDEVLRRLFGRSTPSAQAEFAQAAVPEQADKADAAQRPDAVSAEATSAEDGHATTAANPKMTNGDAADPLDARFVPAPSLPVLREAMVPPFVPYPPSEEEQEREERKAKQVDAIGEDKEDDAPAEQSFHHHDEEEDDTEEDAEDGQDKLLDEESARANDLYWRMAGWT